MYKKVFYFFIFIFSIQVGAFCDSIMFEVINDSKIYHSSDNDRVKWTIEKGAIIESLNIAHLKKNYIRANIIYKGTEGWIDCADIRPHSLGDNLDNSILHDFSDTRKYYLMSYYQDVIKKQDRNLVLKYEDWENKYELDERDPEDQWWKLFYAFTGEFYFFNSFILANSYGTSIIISIKNIKKVNDKYILTATLFREYSGVLKLDWSPIEGKEFFTMILKLDGDYIDVYLENEETKLCELIRVDKPFVDALIDVVQHGKKVDLTKINWPQRAGKEQPKEETTITQTTKKNYYTPTVNNLRFRATPTLDGLFIRHLKAGEQLELIEKGKTETIGDATGTWVKVKTVQGEVGWCFDAYLKEVK